MTKLKVTNMSCAHCVSRISKELEKLESEVTVDLESQTVSIADDSEVQRARTLITDIGYEIA